MPVFVFCSHSSFMLQSISSSIKYSSHHFFPWLTLFQVILLLGYGLDAPPSKLFLHKTSDASSSGALNQSPDKSGASKLTDNTIHTFSWVQVLHFVLWVFIWLCYVLLLSSISLKDVGGLSEMFRK